MSSGDSARGERDLSRSRTDAIDALGIARFARQKRPMPTRLPDSATEELRELVRLRDRVVQDLGDAVRRLHPLVDRGFPELTRYVKTLDSELAGRRKVGGELAHSWSPPPRYRSGTTTATPTGCRSATRAKT